jgi:hypothetical protein
MKRSNVSACDSSTWNQKSRAVTTLETGLAPSSNPCLSSIHSILGLQLPLAAFDRLRYFSTFLIRPATRTMYSGLLNRCIRGAAGQPRHNGLATRPMSRFIQRPTPTMQGLEWIHTRRARMSTSFRQFSFADARSAVQ